MRSATSFAFTGIARPEEFRTVTRAHVIAWRDALVSRGLAGSTIRHRLASLASLFQHLCNENAVTHNPVKGVQRPTAETVEGKTPALGDHQARALLDAPVDETVRGKRDRALLSTLLFHALRRDDALQAEGQGLPPRAQRRAASEGVGQGRQDALAAAASGDQRFDLRLPRGRGAWRR